LDGLRPPNPPEEQEQSVPKEIRKTIRFTDDEIVAIENICHDVGVNFSQYCRSAILGKPIKSRFDISMISQVQKVGNNLNQIAKKLNGGGKIDELILRKLIDIEAKLAKALANGE